MNRLKQTLGELYQFEQMLTWQDIQERLRSTLPADQYAAVLTTGLASGWIWCCIRGS